MSEKVGYVQKDIAAANLADCCMNSYYVIWLLADYDIQLRSLPTNSMGSTIFLPK